METTEIIIRENGALTERIIRERDLNAGPATLDALTEGVTRVLHRVAEIPPWGLTHANVGQRDTLWSIPINRLELNARFRLINGILLPVFASTSDMEMPVLWEAPTDVRLVFAVRTELSGVCHKIINNWLFACDPENRAYRLPLPNLHDDCLICTGNFESHYDTALQCVTASLDQFRKSKWNADLFQTTEESQKFFRFRPTNETIETLPIEAADWRTLCEKVSTAITERIIL